MADEQVEDVVDPENAIYVLVATASSEEGNVGLLARANLSNLFAVSSISSPSYRLGNNYGEIDATVRSSILFDGREGFPNYIGKNTIQPQTPGPGVTGNDSGYVSGAAELAAILSGYDNIINSTAGTIVGQHHMIYSLSDHGTILGGSKGTIRTGVDYGTIVGGTENTIEEGCDYGLIFGGDANVLEAGASDSESGFRSIILGGTDNVAGGRNSTILSSQGCEVQATYGSVFAGVSVALVNGSHAGAGGANITIGGTTTAAYSFAWGEGITIDGARALAVGDSHIVGSGHDRSVVTGSGCITPFAGAVCHASRQRGGTAGNNMSLDFQCGQETTDTTVTRLSTYGSTGYPVQPSNSIVCGRFFVTGVSDAGVCSAFTIDMVSERIGTGTPTLRANATTELYDGLSIVTDPTINVTSGGIYRVSVVGLAATNIRWNARFVGQQVVY